MDTERLEIKNRRGRSLAARLDHPLDGEPVAYVLLVHCLAGEKAGTGAAHVSAGLAADGLGVVRFDLGGAVGSDGSFDSADHSLDATDIEDIARYMATEFQAPAILIGHSLGGAAALRAAPTISSLKLVSTIGAPLRTGHAGAFLDHSSDGSSRSGRTAARRDAPPFMVRKEVLDELLGPRTEEAVAKIRGSLVVFHSPADRIVSIDSASDIFRAARHPKSFVSLDGADHMLSDEADARHVGTLLAAWSRRYVRPGVQEARYVQPDDNRIVAGVGESGFFTRIMANGHALISDEPKAVGGTDAGPTPYDYVVAGLGACTAMTLRMYADRKDWPLEGVKVRLRHRKIHASDCSRSDQAEGMIDHVEREIELEGPLDDGQRGRLIEIANRCPVHRTLERKVNIETTEASAPG